MTNVPENSREQQIIYLRFHTEDECRVRVSHLVSFPSLFRVADVRYLMGSDVETSDNFTVVLCVTCLSFKLNAH